MIIITHFAHITHFKMLPDGGPNKDYILDSLQLSVHITNTRADSAVKGGIITIS